MICKFKIGTELFIQNADRAIIFFRKKDPLKTFLGCVFVSFLLMPTIKTFWRPQGGPGAEVKKTRLASTCPKPCGQKPS